jgi:hypothetical protein
MADSVLGDIMRKAILAAATVIATVGCGNDDNGPRLVTFTATLSSDNIDGTLLPYDATDVPHPFYSDFCKTQPAPVPYPDAGGIAVGSYDPSTKTLSFALEYEGLSGVPIMAHFHHGAAAVAGPIVQTVCGQPPPGSEALGHSAHPTSGADCPASRDGNVTGEYTLAGNADLTPPMTTDEEIALLESGDLYLNVHTCLNEPGEIRGNLVPD